MFTNPEATGDQDAEEEAQEELIEATKDIKTEDLFLHLDPEEAERIRMDRERGGRPYALTRYSCHNPCKIWCKFRNLSSEHPFLLKSSTVPVHDKNEGICKKI